MRRSVFTLKSGETFTGTPNYVTTTHVEIRVGSELRWIERATIEKVAAPPKGER